MANRQFHFVYTHFENGEPYPNGVYDPSIPKRELPDKSPSIATNLYGYSYQTDELEILDHSIEEIIEDEETIYYFPLAHYLPFVNFYFSQDVIDVIEQKSNIIILYYYPIEAYIKGEQFDKIKEILSQFNISKHRKFYITADQGIKNYEFLNHFPFHFIFFDLWQFDSRNQAMGGRLPKLKPKKAILNKQRNKHFLCLNAKDRNHRKYTYWYLHLNDILKKTHVSYIARGGLNSPRDGLEFCQSIKEKREYQKFFKDFTPKVLDVPTEEVDKQDRQVDLYYVKDSYINIVTETWFEDTHPFYRFITEKTWKPILWCQPFIIVGNSGSLRTLRKRGFFTFPEIFDESYDEIGDDHERMRRVMSEIKRLSEKPIDEIHQMYVDVYPKLKYNFNRMWNYDYTSEFLDTFGTIEVIYGQAK